MKKKIAALLTAALVMTMSASTVFAAASPSLDGAATTVKTESVTAKNGDNVTVNSTTAVTDTEATTTASTAAKNAVPSDAEDVNVRVLTDITISGTTVSNDNPVTIVLDVAGVTTDMGVKVLNYYSGAWHEVTAKISANGKVSATFTHFSPVMVVTYTKAPTGGSSWFYDPAIDGPQATATSPKTGVVPFAAMAAGICLAGAAVCGKKVKFN